MFTHPVLKNTTAFAILMVLLMLANDDGIATTTEQEIADMMGLPIDDVDTAIDDLIQMDVLEIGRNRDTLQREFYPDENFCNE